MSSQIFTTKISTKVSKELEGAAKEVLKDTGLEMEDLLRIGLKGVIGKYHEHEELVISKSDCEIYSTGSKGGGDRVNVVEQTQLRMSPRLKDRLKAVADRDKTTINQALRALVMHSLPGLESGKIRFEETLPPSEESAVEEEAA